MGLRPRGSPEQRIESSVRKYLRTGRTADVSRPELLADAERLLSDADGTPPRSPARQRALRLAGWLYLARTGTLNAAAGQLPGDIDTARLLALVRDADPGRIPLDYGSWPSSSVPIRTPARRSPSCSWSPRSSGATIRPPSSSPWNARRPTFRRITRVSSGTA
ncbi:hypothetical protein SAV31267_005130 [Streptomyces avermitilis]|uniref:Uncharacterized protein n=1 Tax=Streptomyces avermitilis TaxID=33903 RepID=A0A4D4MG56_STRAX|nr:hypothetical protein SAV31267_005130 [Streptomyces avermitilis]